MSRHGWVKPLPQGAVARCGGPGMCGHCMAEVIVSKGCPTDDSSEFGGERQCFYCGGDYLKMEGATVTRTINLNHADDCPWPPFEKEFS